MKRVVLGIFFILFLGINSANAVEVNDLTLAKNQPLQTPEQEVNVEPETPKVLLNDDNYKIKGRVEYDENGVLFLDDNETSSLNINVKKQKDFKKKSVFEDNGLLTKIEEQRKKQVPIVDEYLALPFLGASEYKLGNKITYGTTFSTDLDMAQLEYRTKMFAKYDNKFLGFMTAFGKDDYTSSGVQLSSIYLVPELKLSDGVSLINFFKANPEKDRYRADVTLQYRPNINNSRENLAFEVGVSQINYYRTGEMFYQFKLSTQFKF